jgi:hypothetical protein
MRNKTLIVVLCCLIVIGLSSFFYGDNKKAVDPTIKATIISVIDGGLKLRFCLINNSNDTLYYLSTSCNPFIDNIEFDPKIFDVNLHECFWSNNIKLKIAPNGSIIDTIEVYTTKENIDYYGVAFRVGYRWCPLGDSTQVNLYDAIQRPEKNIWCDIHY